MPLRKMLRSAFLGKGKNDHGHDAENSVMHTISGPAAPPPNRAILSQPRSLRPQTARKGQCRRCHYCENMVILPYDMHEGHKRYIPYNHHPSFQHLLNAADQGCDICTIFRDRIVCLGDSRDWKKASVLLFSDEQLEWTHGSISSSEYLETTHLTVKLVSESTKREQTCLAVVKFGLFHQQVTSLKTCVVGRPIASDPRSAQCFDLIDNWLRECSVDHLPCQRNKTDFMPTRIIDVGPNDASREPRLKITKEENLRGPYVALSHCWGGSQTLTTTIETMNERLETISVSSMPANFRDAVWVTRRLGLRYLWIDSLCIIQNSKADWELEAESMGIVYGNSYLTIAAAKAKDSSAGFLQPRSESISESLATLSCSSGDGAKLLNLGLRDYPEGWRLGVEQSVLNGRGWTLQERVMPSRVVHFGKQMVYWECHCAIHSEGGLSPNETVVSNPFIFSKARLHDVWNEQVQGSFSDELERWYTCLDEFSRRKLSYGSDKLPAVAGLAKAMHNRTPQLDVYYAGIWKSDFVRGLLWRAQKLGGLSQPASFRAPSWSWAALDGEITHDWRALKHFDPSWQPVVEGINVRCKGRSGYGEIQSAGLRLKAPMRPAVYVGTPPSQTPAIVGPFGEVLQIANDPKQQWYDLWHFEPDSWQPVGPPLCRAYFDEPIEERKLRPFVLMCLGKFSTSRKPQLWWEENDWICHFWALILEPVDMDSGPDGSLKRVGVAMLDEKNPFRGWGAVAKTIV